MEADIPQGTELYNMSAASKKRRTDLGSLKMRIIERELERYWML